MPAVFKELAVEELMAGQEGLPVLIRLKRLWPRILSGKIECQLCTVRLDPKFREIYKDAQLSRSLLKPLPMLFPDCSPFH